MATDKGYGKVPRKKKIKKITGHTDWAKIPSVNEEKQA